LRSADDDVGKFHAVLLFRWCYLPGKKLLKSQKDQAHISMMGFDCETVNKILDKFGPMFSSHMPFDESGFIVPFEYVSGQKRKVQPEDCLGLVLVWT
jgi:hypothetical protein